MKNRLSPSVLAADFSALAEDLRLAEDAGAESFHFDIMDGHFVPNLSYGVNVVSALRKQSKAFFDVHLMVTNPDFYLASCKEAGADRVSFHFEATPHVDRALEAIKDLQMEAGIALNPATPVAFLEEILPKCSYILLMSVNPGFGGQRFIEGTLDKVARLRKLINDSGSRALIEVDGGVNDVTAPKLVAAGADVLVSGSYIFKASDPLATIHRLKHTTTAPER